MRMWVTCEDDSAMNFFFFDELTRWQASAPSFLHDNAFICLFCWCEFAIKWNWIVRYEDRLIRNGMKRGKNMKEKLILNSTSSSVENGARWSRVIWWVDWNAISYLRFVENKEKNRRIEFSKSMYREEDTCNQTINGSSNERNKNRNKNRLISRRNAIERKATS